MTDYDKGSRSDEDLLTEVKDCFKEARRHSANWRTEAIENYDFVAGHQWSAEDTATLEEQKRPVVTFNRMGPYFDAVAGSEINNRQEIKYLPRTPGDSKQNELLNAAVKWVLDNTDAQDQESDSFVDMLVAGMGWIETTMDYDDNPDGMVKMSRVDPLEMFWDPLARKKNLKDKTWFQRHKWTTKEEIKDKWPDAAIADDAEPWGDDNVEKTQPHHQNLAFLYKNNTGEHYDDKTGKYRVVQHCYYEKEDVWRVFDPVTKRSVFLTKEKYEFAQAQAQKAGIALKFVKQKKKIYKCVFVCGGTVLEKKNLPCGWNFNCMTGKRDHNTNLWYGLARTMKDPQRWANKFLAQIMHIVNSNAKGGLLAEEGAFVDPKKAEETWADPTAVILLKNGGLARVKERTQANYPTGLDKLLQFAIGSIPDVTGVNLEFLGMADREQAGVLESERKKSAYIILALFFDSLRLYRKEQGRLLAHYVKEYLNDGRIIRITTDEGEMPVPLVLTDEVIEYDVVVDQAPNSPNLKEEVWNALGSLLPKFVQAGIPVPPSIFKYSPLPESVANEFAQGLAGRPSPQVAAQMEEMGATIQKLTLENASLKTQHVSKMAAVESRHELGKEKNAIEAASVQNEATAGLRDLQAEIIKINAKQQSDMQTMRSEFIRDMEISRREMAAELVKIAAQAEVKRADHQMKMAEKREKDAEKKAEKEAKASVKEPKPPVINITNVMPSGKKSIKFKKGANGEVDGADVTEAG